MFKVLRYYFLRNLKDIKESYIVKKIYKRL